MSLIRARYRAVNTVMNLGGARFVGLLDLYPNAAAAYSLRKLRAAYSGSAVRVRRSSDNTEQDIGFVANGELDTTALLAFVNEETIFLNDTFDGSYSYTVALGSASVTGGVLDFPDTSTTIVFTSLTNTLKTQQVRVTFTILNYVSGSIRFENYNSGAVGTTRSANGTYVETFTIASSGNNNFGFNGTMQGQIDNFKIEQLTADGHVVTWYDQSLSNDATQATAANQPKIVSAGSLIELNSKAAINGDGANDILSLSTGLNLSSGYSIFQVVQVPLANSNGITISSSDTINISRIQIFNGLYRLSAAGTNYDNYSTAGNRGAQYLWSSVVDGSGNLDTNRNGSAYGSTITSVTGTFELDIIGTNIGVNSFEYFQELIVFNSDQSANRTGIETNINDYFNIYP